MAASETAHHEWVKSLVQACFMRKYLRGTISKGEVQMTSSVGVDQAMTASSIHVGQHTFANFETG